MIFQTKWCFEYELSSINHKIFGAITLKFSIKKKRKSEIPTFLLRFFTTSLKTEFCSLNKTSCGSSFLSFTVHARCLRFFMLPSNKLPDSVKFLKAVAGNGYIWLTGDGIYLKVEDNTYLPLQVDRQSRHPRRNVLKFQVGSPTRNFDSRAPFSDLRILLPALPIDLPITTKNHQ